MKNKCYLMGIDTGTTHTKVGVYDTDGKEIIFKKSSTPIVFLSSGGAEFNPQSIWEKLVQLIKEIPLSIRDNVKAVSIGSFAETVYPLDAKDTPLDNGIAWFDLRTLPQNEKVKNLLGEKFIREITGLSPSWIYSLNKILWFKENKPLLYKRTKKWLDNAGYIIFKLSGEKVIDYSLACRTMMFDVKNRCWSKRILGEFDIDVGTLPEPVPSGTVIGKVDKHVSENTGLKEGTLVVSGGHDHLCAALSVGVIEEGRIQDSTGTTESILVTLKGDTKKIIEITEIAQKEGFTLANHVVKDAFCLFQGMYCGGLLLDWFLGNILKNVDYSILEKIVSYEDNIPFFIPYLRGSEIGIMSGALLGLKDFHTRESILASITETVAFELKKMVDSLEKFIDISGWIVRSVGGGAENKLLLKCKANLLGKKVEVSEHKEATSKGAALLAGIGCGVYKDEFEAVEKTFNISEVYTPEVSQAEKIQRRYEKYRKILAKYKEIEENLK